MKPSPAAAVLLAAALLGAGACADSPPVSPEASPDASSAVIAKVIDGDTVTVDFDGTRENVRLIGIDTPEPRGGYQPPECFGDEASSYAAQLLPEGTVVLVTRDIEARDVYDRLLGYLYRASDGLFINLDLVESGHADTLNIAPNDTFAAEFSAAAARARAAGAGLWGTCGGSDVLVAD